MPATETPPGAPDPSSAIRRRLLDRVADDDGSHLTIDASQGEWRPFGAGVAVKVLHQRDGVMSYLLRLEAGARLPAHRHPIDEECVVLAGTLQVGSRVRLGPGSYHRAHQGALHAPVSTDTGATIFLRGAIPRADDVLA